MEYDSVLVKLGSYVRTSSSCSSLTVLTNKLELEEEAILEVYIDLTVAQ